MIKENVAVTGVSVKDVVGGGGGLRSLPWVPQRLGWKFDLVCFGHKEAGS